MEPTVKTELEQKIIQALRSVYDPEIPVSLYDMGLIYNVHISDDGSVSIDMTLTAPGCPVADSLPYDVECAVKKVPGVTNVSTQIVWDPPWHQDMMSEAAKLQLGLL